MYMYKVLFPISESGPTPSTSQSHGVAMNQTKVPSTMTLAAATAGSSIMLPSQSPDTMNQYLTPRSSRATTSPTVHVLTPPNAVASNAAVPPQEPQQGAASTR